MSDEFRKDSLVPVGNMDNEPKFVAAQIILVAPEELARRPLAPPPIPERGYALLYRRKILQADRGCDFNFLRKNPLGGSRSRGARQLYHPLRTSIGRC
jgi:hypothetical protein